VSKFAVRALAEALHGDLKGTGRGLHAGLAGLRRLDIRRTDNRGGFHPEAPDPIPAWLRMRTDQAARIMVRGILAGKREVKVTFHGKVMIFVGRHMSGLMRWLLVKSYQARPEPKSARPLTAFDPGLEAIQRVAPRAAITIRLRTGLQSFDGHHHRALRAAAFELDLHRRGPAETVVFGDEPDVLAGVHLLEGRAVAVGIAPVATFAQVDVILRAVPGVERPGRCERLEARPWRRP
jgi:hypothetical protein